MAKYIGITIGPIHDTMMLSSKPAALWGASFLFSYLGKELCLRMQEIYKEECEIIVPYANFDTIDKADNYLSKMKEGVGLIHDRVIAVMKCDGTEEEIVKDVNEKVIEPVRMDLTEKILADIQEDSQTAKDELKDYFQIYAVCMEIAEGSEIVTTVSGALDILELEKQFVPESTQDFLHSFLENEVLKASFLAKDLDKAKWQLMTQRGTIRAIEDIAGEKKYYALVQADGDGMGKVLCSLTTPDLVSKFSEKCINYSAKAADVIGKHGGITIYAGGDDLLFLAPVAKEKTNILSLIRELRETFAKEFKEAEYAECNVSYGVQIVYESFPLYEAFDMASKLLFVKAKDKRNSCAIAVQKHSGQSVEFVLHNFSDDKGKSSNPITDDLISLIEAKCENDFLKSASKHIRDQLEAFRVAIDKQCIESLMKNLFDNEMQQKYEEDLKIVKKLFESTLKGNISYHKDAELAILALLRYADFYSGGGEKKNVTQNRI